MSENSSGKVGPSKVSWKSACFGAVDNLVTNHGFIGKASFSTVLADTAVYSGLKPASYWKFKKHI